MGKGLPPRVTFISTRGPVKSKAALSARAEVDGHSSARRAIESPASTLLANILNPILFLGLDCKICATSQSELKRHSPRYKLWCTWNFIRKAGWELPSIDRESRGRSRAKHRFY